MDYTTLDKNLLVCIQCGTCSASCIFSHFMDYTPRQIIRMVQLDMYEDILHSNAIWFCATCFSCTVRCPREIDVAGVMRKLRYLALEKGIKTANTLFDKISINAIEKYGKFPECFSAIRYTIEAGSLQHIHLGVNFLNHGKLKFFPKRIEGLEEIKEIFEKLGK